MRDLPEDRVEATRVVGDTIETALRAACDRAAAREVCCEGHERGITTSDDDCDDGARREVVGG